MDSALEKFGIYDLMGIWGAGALAVTYFLFTVWNSVVRTFTLIGISNPIKSELYLLVILYSAVAYFAGVLLQELGKIIFGGFYIFRTESANDLLKNNYVNPHGPGWRIRSECITILKNTISEDLREIINFDEAYSYIKYTKESNIRRTDKYHSAYALARSLFLCFVGHAGFQIFSFIKFNTCCRQMVFFLAVDTLFALIFFVRSYRYFNSWIRNVFIQYVVEKFGNHN